MTVLEVKPHKVYIRDLVPYRTAVMFSMAAFFAILQKNKKIPTLSAPSAKSWRCIGRGKFNTRNKYP